MILINDRLRHERRENRLTLDPELNRLVDFGRLSAHLIHEISTPLTSAALTLDQMNNENSDRLRRKIKRDLRQLERYISAARYQLKGESPKTSFSLTVAIHQIVMMLSESAKQNNIRILVQTMGKVRIYGDRIKFFQILSNLIKNAIESFDNSPDRSRVIQINVTQNKGNIVISISDNGSGIGHKHLGHIYDAFYSTKKNKNQGLGIGLAIVKQYVEQDFNGSVKVRSRNEVGTTFKVILPYTKNA